MSAFCRSCHARVVWRRHIASGAWLILDARPDPLGTVDPLDNRTCRVLTGEALQLARRLHTPLLLDHHATCPFASEWRQRA